MRRKLCQVSFDTTLQNLDQTKAVNRASKSLLQPPINPKLSKKTLTLLNTKSMIR